MKEICSVEKNTKKIQKIKEVEEPNLQSANFWSFDN